MSSPGRPASGLGAIARAAGVTRAAVSYALRNKPGVSSATRERILRIAKEFGYAPDARVASWMAAVRESKTRELLPIAWLNHHTSEKNAWRTRPFLTPYLEGARDRARELGYRLEEIWTREPGMTMRRLSKILYQRGIEGVIVTEFVTHFSLEWKHFAGVALEHFLVAPALPRVETDVDYNLFLAVKMVRKAGYRRIGFCFEEGMKGPAHFTFWPMITHLNGTVKPADQIPPLLYQWSNAQSARGRKQVIEWVRRHRPEVIICHSNGMVEWVEDAGFSVPDDIGVVHLATDDDVSDWAGICSNRRVIGATALDWATSRIIRRDLGVPAVAPVTRIRGSWHPGKTLAPGK